MDDFEKWLQHQLAQAGVPPTRSGAIMNNLADSFGGERIYVAKITAERREQVRALVRAGVAPRTARWKVRP